MPTLQRETYEFRPVTLRDAAGLIYTGGWHYQITVYGARPTGTWLPAVTHAGKVGFVIQNLAAGTYLLYPRLDDDNPYLPVVEPVPFTVA
jgi:hypothetical protein